MAGKEKARKVADVGEILEQVNEQKLHESKEENNNHFALHKRLKTIHF